MDVLQRSNRRRFLLTEPVLHLAENAILRGGRAELAAKAREEFLKLRDEIALKVQTIAE